MKKYFSYLCLSIVATMFAYSKTYAICGVCTAAALAGVGLSRWLKIDDTISGVWIGAFTASSIIWTFTWLDSKKIKFILDKFLIAIAYYALILIPFYKSDIIGHPKNVLLGIDKLVFGIVAGSLVLVLSSALYTFIKKKNNNKAHFPFEKVALPVASLLVATGIFYLVTK